MQFERKKRNIPRYFLHLIIKRDKKQQQQQQQQQQQENHNKKTKIAHFLYFQKKK
jgi:hypothetical protein